MKKANKNKKLKSDQRWVPGAEGRYAVDEGGQVWSFTRSAEGRRIGSQRSTGYVTISYADRAGAPLRSTGVHRLVYEAFHGPIPEGYHIDHLNCVRNDNRPENLEAVTPAENDARTDARGRRPAGSTHGHARLTEDAVREARTLYAGQQVTMDELATRYGVSKAAIAKAVAGDTWSHVPGALVGTKFRRGARHGVTRLTEDDVRAIRKQYTRGGVTHVELAKEYGVCRRSIGNIIARRTWEHVEEEI